MNTQLLTKTLLAADGKPEGWFTEADAELYRRAVSRVKGGTIVEVGTWLGRSLSHILPIATANRNQIWCVDQWISPLQMDGSRRILDFNPRAVFEANMRHLEMWQYISLLHEESTHAASNFLDESVDIVYLDAGHLFEEVVQDIRAWWPKLRSGGVLLGHDWQPAFPGVRKAVELLLGKPDRMSGTTWEITKCDLPLKSNSLIEAVGAARVAAAASHSKLDSSVFLVPGMTSPFNQHFLNGLCQALGHRTRYLEVGAFKGASSIAASYNNLGRFVTIDDFSEFSADNTRHEFQTHLRMFEKQCSIEFIEASAWDVASNLAGREFNVFYYDGNHSEEAQGYAIISFLPALAETFILIVDDWNWEHVRRGTQKALSALSLKIEHQWEMFTPECKNCDLGSCWNGLWAGVISKHQ